MLGEFLGKMRTLEKQNARVYLLNPSEVSLKGNPPAGNIVKFGIKRIR